MASGDQITVEVIRPPAKDTFGDPLPGPPDDFLIPGCLFAPGPSAEIVDGANQVRTDGTVYAPAGADVRPDDKVKVRGVIYEVVGRPQDWGRAGVVVVLREVTG
ncbi:hypothetical protein [Micromonospora sp. NPDC047730]|uniref:hypothetical protein n=1 Tax=Micromonospora sp. NPDC047730 TaxID=3364253 RepID=UPI0037242136